MILGDFEAQAPCVAIIMQYLVKHVWVSGRENDRDH